MKKVQTLKRSFLALVLAIVSIVTIFPTGTIKAAEVSSNTYYGGGEIADKNYTVYSSPNWSTAIGSIYYNEGYTVLVQDRPAGYLWIEYSTSKGAKRGYIKVPVDDAAARSDAVAQVAVNSTVYYGRTDHGGTYGQYQSAGTVYAGEFVAIWAKNDDWAYIEYNTTSGRKRGYVKYSNLTVFNRPGIYPDIYPCKVGRADYKSGRQYVYSGPTTLYTQVGWVENENVTVLDDDNIGGHYVQYVEYSSGSGTKSGFLIY